MRQGGRVVWLILFCKGVLPFPVIQNVLFVVLVWHGRGRWIRIYWALCLVSLIDRC
jgi:hypothetical protein